MGPLVRSCRQIDDGHRQPGGSKDAFAEIRCESATDLSMNAMRPARTTWNRHFPFMLIGVVVPILAMLLRVDEERVAFRAAPSLPLPPTCVSQSLLGIDCPACGLTRSLVFLVEGRFFDSLARHRLGWLVFAVIVAQIPYRLWCLSRREPQFLRKKRAEYLFWLGLLGLLILNRIWDLIVGL